MHVQTAPRSLPTFQPMTAARQPDASREPSESFVSGENADRALVLGGAVVTLGTVAFACMQGHPGAALGGGVLAAATGMALGLPLAMAGHVSTSESIGLYVASSLTTLSVGTAAGALLGGSGMGMLAAAGSGALAAAAGNVVGRHI